MHRFSDRLRRHGCQRTIFGAASLAYATISVRASFRRTDGACEGAVAIPFDHAFLLPEGQRLPVASRGEVFTVK